MYINIYIHIYRMPNCSTAIMAMSVLLYTRNLCLKHTLYKYIYYIRNICTYYIYIICIIYMRNTCTYYVFIYIYIACPIVSILLTHAQGWQTRATFIDVFTYKY